LDATEIMRSNYGKAARLLFKLPRQSRVFIALEPSSQWDWNEVLLNKIAYLLEIVVWQNATPSKKGEKAKHESLKPTLFLPEFMKTAQQKAKSDKGTMAADVDTIKDLLSRPRVKPKKP